MNPHVNLPPNPLANLQASHQSNPLQLLSDTIKKLEARVAQLEKVLTATPDGVMLRCGDSRIRVGRLGIELISAKDVSLTAGLNATLTAGKDLSWSIGSNAAISCGSNVTFTAGSTFEAASGQDYKVTAGKGLALTGGDDATVKVGDAMVVLKRNGDAAIKGKDILLNGSGKIAVKASGDISLKGSKINQN